MASVDSLRSVPVPRLAGKVAVITGAAGTIGSEISRRYLAEGARIAMVGRDGDKLAAARIALIAETHVDADCIFVSPFDASDPAQTRVGIERILAHFGRIDVLVNNAGSAGPRQRLENVPTSRADLERLRAGGASDTETVGDAARNLFGVAWNVVRAAAPHLAPGASIINISTIFSRTAYFGRAAYVVPKAALNSWSRRLAYELGERGIRVNTVFPGPIESERIHSVFASMDALRSAPSGTTAN
jgi:malonyl-CoA reductase/3-hydroxypropionate dehydrogenase (NADP+)